MAEEISYLNFDLLVEPADEGYRVRVLDSPSGQSSSVNFRLPFSQMELENFLLRVGARRRGVRGGQATQMTRVIRLFGGQLYEAFFRDGVRLSFERSLDEASIRDVGLRIRLRLVDAPELADLPWEYLYDPGRRRFLCLSYRTPLVRYLELSDPPRALALSRPLRVLVVISNPVDVDADPLDVEHEWANIVQALAGLRTAGQVEVERLIPPTLAALQKRLRRGHYHVLHFIGHGRFDADENDGQLLLEDQTGRGRATSGNELGTLLYDHRWLRLAVLNACEGARSGSTDPFAGTAQSLIQQGIPAVVAMQFEISDPAAISFSQALYEAVADGYPLDAAIAEARKAIYAQPNPVEWATPVLYLRAADGRIFDLDPSFSAASRASAATRVEAQPPNISRTAIDQASEPEHAGDKAPEPQQLVSAGISPASEVPVEDLEELYIEGLAAFYTERWDAAVSIFSRLVAHRSDYKEAEDRLQEALRQQELTAHYTAALAAAEAGLWSEAVEHLETLLATKPDYLDARELLEEARRNDTIADLRTEVHALFEAEQWEAVVAIGERLHAMDSSVADPDGLVSLARSKVQEIHHARLLAAHYKEALSRMGAGAWSDALEALESIRQLDPEYRDTETLLAYVHDKAARQAAREAAHQQELSGARARVAATLRARILALEYSAAKRHIEAKVWDEAYSTILRIQGMQPSYRDTDSLLRQVLGALARERAANRKLLPELRLLQELKHQRQVGSLAFSPNGRQLATACDSKSAYIWDLDKSQVVTELTHPGFLNMVQCVAFSPDGRLLATGCNTGPATLRVWDPSAAKVMWKDSPGSVRSVAFSPNGRLLASGCVDGKVVVWDVHTGKERAKFKHTAEVWSVAFSPNGELLATGSYDHSARIWNVRTRNEIYVLTHSGSVGSVDFSPDGRLLATGSGGTDNSVRIWHVDTGEESIKFGTGSSIRKVAFSPDGGLLATGSDRDKTVHVFDASSGQDLLSAKPGGNIYGLAFSPDGRMLASGGSDKTVRTWLFWEYEE